MKIYNVQYFSGSRMIQFIQKPNDMIVDVNQEFDSDNTDEGASESEVLPKRQAQGYQCTMKTCKKHLKFFKTAATYRSHLK